MELRTQAADRLLEALAPALSAELERIIQEVQQNLEVDFQKSLQAAVHEAEAASRRVAEVEREQAVEETRDAVRKQVTEEATARVTAQVTEELQVQFNRTLEETTAQLREDFARELQTASGEWAADRARLAEQLEEWRIFADAQRQLLESGSQAEILVRFLKLAERFAPSTAVYLSKPDGLALWKSRGGAVFPSTVSPDTVDRESFFHQIMVRDKLVLAVCAAPPYKLGGLNFLTACLERSIESFGMKLRSPAPQPPVSEPSRLETGPAADEKMRAEARRMARLLVSEIKLYHEQEVQDGRANGDLYERLGAEIESSREQFGQRFSSTAPGAADYFHEEIVRVLADGDISRLGSRYPGSAAK